LQEAIMAQAKKTKVAKTETKKLFDGDVARRIWLAGVGAYGRAYDEAQDAAEKFAAKSSETFDQLVAKGEVIEDSVRASLAKAPAGKKVATLIEDVSKKSKEVTAERRAQLDERIESVRKSLGETLAPFNLNTLAHAVQSLTEQVEALTEEVQALKAERAEKAPKKIAKAVETSEEVA